jgi:hypothetical protein
MKYKVSELEGTPLDKAVALANGWKYMEVRSPSMHVDGFGRDLPGRQSEDAYAVGVEWVDANGKTHGNEFAFRPSKSWFHGGPLIEREGIELWRAGDAPANAAWRAYCDGPAIPTGDAWDEKLRAIQGPTPLVAAMRAYVISRLGDEVEL